MIGNTAGRGRRRLAESNVKMVESRRARGAWHSPETVMKMRETKRQASEPIRTKIAEIIASEDPSRPLMDKEILELLASAGIHVSRRTVGNYRGRPAARKIIIAR